MSSRSSGVSSALSSLDRTLTASDDVVVLGPLRLPPLPDLRAAVGQLSLALPQARLGWSLEAASGHWVPGDATPEQLGEQLVVAAPELDAVALGFGAFAQRAAALRPRDVPVTWVVAGDWLALSISHAVGDADLINALATGLVETALTAPTGRVPAPTSPSSTVPASTVPASTVPTSTAHPLLRALVHHYGRRPSRVVAAVRAVLSARAEAPAVTPTSAPGSSPSAVHAVVTAGAARDLKAWQREHAAALSPLALQTVLAHRALASVGAQPDPRALVLFDVRAYLPPGVSATGNFVIGVRVLVSPPGLPLAADLATTDASIRAAFAAGRPLTAMVAVQLQALVRRLPARRPRTAAAGAPPSPAAPSIAASSAATTTAVRPTLVVTALGRRGDVEALPWREGAGEPVFSAMGSPAAGEVTFAATFLKGRRQYSLSFDPSAFEVATMQRALDVLAHEPLTLLAPPLP